MKTCRVHDAVLLPAIVRVCAHVLIITGHPLRDHSLTWISFRLAHADVQYGSYLRVRMSPNSPCWGDVSAYSGIQPSGCYVRAWRCRARGKQSANSGRSMSRAPGAPWREAGTPLQGMWHPASGPFAMQGHAPLLSQGQHLATFSSCQELLLSSSSPALNTVRQTSYRAAQVIASRGSLPILGSHFPLFLSCHNEATQAKDGRLEQGRPWPGRRLLLELGCPQPHKQ